MKTLNYRAQIEKIEGNKIFYTVPQPIYESEIEDLDEPRVCDPANLKRDFLDFSRSVYIGNKRRICQKIVELVPEEVKSIYDPMCGFSAVLRELAEQGKTVLGNDLNLTAYYFSKALFLSGKKPSEEEAKEFINSAEEHDGFFAKSSYWPAAKVPNNYERFIDGFVKKAQESDRPSFYLGVAASYMSAVIGGFGGPYHPKAVGYFKIDALKNSLLGYAKELLSCEATGTITCKNALTMEIPDVDLIYFDPPYKEGNPTYFNRYAKANSILIQEDWKTPEEITQKQVAEFGKKLQGCTDILVISTSPLSPVSWKKVLGDSGREIYQKRFQMTGTGLGNAAENLNQRKLSELIWISTKKSLAEIVKAKNPFMIYPPEDREYKYMQHAHFRGRSVHNDLRIEGLGKQNIIGWTLMTAQAGKIKEPILTMQDARKIVANSKRYFKIDFQTGEWAKRKRAGAAVNVSIVAVRKVLEPSSWLTFEGVTPKEGTGATKEFPGVYVIVDKGIVSYLSQKSLMHEYWFNGKVLKRGRYLFRQLRAWKKTEKSEEELLEIIGGENVWEHIRELNQEALGILKNEGMTDEEIAGWIKPQIAEIVNELGLTEEDIEKAFVIPPGKEGGIGKDFGWLFIKPIDQTPYVFSLRAIKESWLPSSGFSALPKHWRSHVKSEEEYWKMSGQKALDARKAFRERLKKEGVLKKAEEGNPDPFKKAVIKKQEIAKEESLQVEYRLTYQWWKGQRVIREGPSEPQYHIWLKSDKKILDFLANDNILESSSTSGILYKDRSESEMNSEGYVKPGTKLNPTKVTPSFIKLLDRGEAIMLIDSPNLKKIQFNGAKMKGTFLFKNVENYWDIKRVEESSKEEVE